MAPAPAGRRRVPRNRHRVTDDHALGPAATSDALRIDAARAEAALKRATRLGQQVHVGDDSMDLLIETRHGRSL
ncbi:hypothetical protein QWL27_03560 [Streptomyces thermocarboxydus]|uniref:Uncharacterized protein n=1 Tax=Streptomyces cellulosae TaxID=1968 RepID=A0ABW6JP78_STRCE|nr:hypothetical protein [Streptomyces sp. AC04842]MDN3284856.1 hypothetical protein [Streptomyces thermocarboxydus]